MAANTLTTGKLAKYLDVAPRTISKWIDSGKLKGFRLPGSQDRRVLYDDLVVFCRDMGYPIPDRSLEQPKMIYVIGGKITGFECFDSSFELGIACANNAPRLIVVIQNDSLAKELTKYGYKILNGNDMSYNEIKSHIETLERGDN